MIVRQYITAANMTTASSARIVHITGTFSSLNGNLSGSLVTSFGTAAA